MKNDPVAVSFYDLERICEINFNKHKYYWHLYTDGRSSDIIFRDASEMKVGMNLMAIASVSYSDVKVLTHALMNNHLHMILIGQKERCVDLFMMFKARLWKYFSRNGRVIDMHKFQCQMIGIASLQSLRNELVYVNRNGYVVRADCTPFSYPWGAGAYFFNPFLNLIPSIRLDDLSIKAKRLICRSNDVMPGGNLYVYDDVILPSSYCDIATAESFFRSAHHYFQCLTKRYEAYGEIAARLHETIFLPDEELYPAVCALCTKLYGLKNPGLLNVKDRIDLAKKIKQDYNASNRQIKSILKLDPGVVDELFPNV